MKKNMNLTTMAERIEQTIGRDWYSRINQTRYWTGSPWRALNGVWR